MGPSRDDVCTYIQENFCELKGQAVERFVNRMAYLTPAEVCEGFCHQGAAAAEFDVEAIPAEAEMDQAILLILFLIACADLQTDR